MAGNIQFPNNATFQHINYFSPDLRQTINSQNEIIKWNSSAGDTMYSNYQKITDICPSLCFQADVFLPNARAAVQSVSCEVSPDTPGRYVMGCKGHQVQNDFLLEPLIPVAVPVVQYPAFKLGFSIEERDICAVPVLNWEEYICTLKRTFRGGYGATTAVSLGKPVRLFNPMEDTFKQLKKKAKWEKKYENLLEEDRPPLEAEPSDDSSSCSDSSDGSDTNITNYGGRVLKKLSMQKLKKKLFKINEDLSLTPEEQKLRKRKEQIERSIMEKQPKKRRKQKQASTASVQLPKRLLRKYAGLSRYHKKSEGMIHPESIRKVKNMPELRIEATWNYFYGGSNGACCSVRKEPKVVDVFVGNKTQLRKIQLKETPSSTISYTVGSVWEEDKSAVPSNIRQGCDEPLSDVVFQVVPNRQNLIGVRRGKSIEIYDNNEESPSLLDSIPNICYGSRNYEGWKKNSVFDAIKDPLLLGLDFNPQFAPEFISVDENRVVRIGDFNAENTVSSYQLRRLPRHWPNLAEWPRFQHLNNGSGVCFCPNGHTFLTWVDSKIILGDRRDSSFSRTTLTEIFDARRSTTTLSWSDQKYFNDSRIELNDYVSAVKMSTRDFYYYVGTTTRVMLMDIRVPGQPVLKSSHGMKSAASQLDTYVDDNFEVLVAASQRVPTTFCMISDHAHVSCVSRPNCEAKNPILTCLPKHLSSSTEFFDAVVKSGLTCTGEADHQRSKAQSNAWTTGVNILKSPVGSDPRHPPSLIVLTSNSYGDLYYQEWLQKSSMSSCTPLKSNDDKFRELIKQWRNSMSSSFLEYTRPNLNFNGPVNISLTVETCARNVSKMPAIRDTPFSAVTPDEFIHRHVLENQLDISKQLDQLRVTTESTKKFFDVWDEDGTTEVAETVNIKEEVVEGDGNLWNEDENNYDIQVLSQEDGQNADAVRVDSPSSSDAEDLIDNFESSGNIEPIPNDEESNNVFNQESERPEFVEDIDYFAEESICSPQESNDNDDYKPPETSEEDSELKHDGSFVITDHQREVPPPVRIPVPEEEEVKLNLDRDYENVDLESMLISRFPQAGYDENMDFSEYDQPPRYSLSSAHQDFQDNPLGYEDGLNVDSLSYGSSQSSIRTKKGSSKNTKRSGF